MEHFSLRYSAFVIATVSIVFLFFGSGPVSAQNQATGASLTEAEQWSVLNAALATGVANGATSLAEAQALRQEVLLIEGTAEANGQSGVGKAYIYDYTTDTLNVITVDLLTSQSILHEALIGVQLPLVIDEIDRAVQIGIGNPAILTQIETAFQEISGEPFTALEQLTIEASLFQASSAQSLVNMQSADCGIHRCAILSMQTRSGERIPVQPVVDLSTQQVAQNITDPLAIVAEPGNLGFVDTGRIVDEDSSSQLPSGAVATGMIVEDSAAPSRNEVDDQVSAAPSQQEDVVGQQELVVRVEPIPHGSTDVSGGAATPGSAKTDIFIPIVARRNLNKSLLVEEMSFGQVAFVNWWCSIVDNSPLSREIRQLCQP